MSVPVVIAVALIFLLPTTSGELRITLAIVGAIIAIGWLIVVWYLLAVRAASPGLKVTKLQVVGFLDGRPIGLTRAFIRGLVFWALYITGIGLLLMLVFELRHPRKQGWHDLAATAVMIKERVLAPQVQPARAAASAMQSPPSPALNGSPQPNGARPAMPAGPTSPSYAGGEGYGSAVSPVPPGQLTPPTGMGPPGMGGYPTGPASPYAGASAMPQGAPTGPSGGNAYATPHPGSPYVPPQQYGPPQQYAPQPQYGGPGGELYAPGQQGGKTPQPQMPQQQNGPPSAGSPYEPMPDDTAGDDLADPTSVAQRSPYLQEWSILLDDGRRIALDGLILLGRNPQPNAGEEDAQLIKIADETRTVSKSHLAIGLDAGGVYVVDRGSTNGSTVSTTKGMSTRCKAGEMVRVGEGAIVSIGDHWLEITRGS